MEMFLKKATPSSPALFALSLAIVMTQGAIFLNNGMYTPGALLCISIAIAAIYIGIFYARRDGGRNPVDAPVVALLSFGIVCNIIGPVKRFLLGSATPLGNADDAFFFAAGVLLAGVLLLVGLWFRKLKVRWMIVPIVALHLLLGSRMILTTPDPFIDVVSFQKEGCQALVEGKNPYAIRLKNIYGGKETSLYYAPESVDKDGLKYGFLYPPLSLLMALPGHLLGDVRYAHLAAMELTALLLAFMGPGRLGLIAAGLYLFGSLNLFVLLKGWTEPFAVLLFTFFVFASVRRWRALPFLLGLLLSVKQYMVWAAFPALLLSPKGDKRTTIAFVARTAVVVLLVNLPFALWNWQAFLDSTLLFHLAQPFRTDSLGYLFPVYSLFGIKLPSVIGFAAAIAMTVFVLRRTPRTPFGFALGVGAIMIVFFAFNKQAFANYYFFIIGALCCAMAARGAADNRSARDHEVFR